MTGNDTRPELPQQIKRTIRLTQASMAAERTARAFWPLAALAVAVWALISFGILDPLSRAEAVAALSVSGLMLGYLAFRGIRAFRWPGREAALNRLDATLAGHPLTTLRDTPAAGSDDPAVLGVWRIHLERMAQRAAKARPIPADLRLSRFDPWAFRLAALVLFAAALFFARDDALESVTASLTPAEASVTATGPSYEGWAEPPAYTGLPTIYLPEVSGGDTLSVPEGTVVTLRVYGEAADFGLVETVSGGESPALAGAADGIALSEFPVTASGDVRLLREETALGQWAFDLIPDDAPVIEAAGPVERSVAGEMNLPFMAQDDYGVTAARAEITLDLDAVNRRYGRVPEPEPRPEIVVDLPLPMTGGAEEVAETLVEDFSKHPWVGLPVRITLHAEDAREQAGRQDGITATLPGRRFYDPMAAAVAEQRRDILWSAGNARRVSQVLRAVTHRPDDIFDSPRAYLIVRKAIRQLEAAHQADRVAAERDEIAEALWQAALLLEEGSLGDAAERLARAKERLAEALRNDASDEEIAQLMDELRQATRDYMEQMARDLMERGEMQSAEAPPPGQTMSQDQIQQLMDRIQELSEQGRRAEAEALLDMLQQLLENMEMQFAQGSGQGQTGQGQQSMQGLADALRQQQGLADESFQQLQRQFRQGQQGQQPGQQGQDGQEPGGDLEGLADRQEALRGLVEDLQSQLPGAAGEGTQQALRDAQRNMEEAEQGLRDGDAAGALDRQAEAIDNLREGMRGLSEDIRQAEGNAPGGEGENNQAANPQGEDPLGRPTGSRGAIGTDRRMLPEGDAAARARSILDEIRRRSGDLARPQVELDYLRRLLDRF